MLLCHRRDGEIALVLGLLLDLCAPGFLVSLFIQKVHFCIQGPLTPDGHGTSGGNHRAWLSHDDEFVEVPFKEVGEKELGLFVSNTEKVTLADVTLG